MFDKSGQILNVGYDDNNIRLFNPKNMKMDKIYKGHDDSVLDIGFDANNRFMVSCGADRTFRIWN